MKQKLNVSLLILNCLILFQHGLIMLILGPMVPEIMEHFSINESTMGLLLGAGSMGFALGPLLGGLLLDRRGLRLTLVLGFALETVFLILFGLMPLFIVVVIINFALIFMGGQIETAGNYLPLEVGGKSPGVIMNLVHFFFSIGAFIGPFFIGIFLSRGGRWQAVFFAAAVPTFILAVVFLFMKQGKKVQSGPADAKHTGLTIRKMLSEVKHPAVIFGSFTLLFYVGAEIGFSSWIVNYLEKKLAFSKFYASFGLSLLWIGIMAGRLLNAFAARHLSSRLLVFVGSGLGVVSGIAMLFLKSITPVYIVIFLIGIAMSGIYPNTMAEINRRFPEAAGAVTGVMVLGGGLGAMLFQWLIGLIAQRSGLTASLICIPALMGLLAAAYSLAHYFLKRKTNKPETQSRGAGS